ncbi:MULTISPECIES: hypothetical protein [Alicyclobacillus]|uniref:Uncharacterized protein n=1 Tax=Alicyclobacillus acidoterrestris (strain ATCC 49025 / DSM 3922 / CIP 106132 / NCIMB 13137 / GD3B) TaxID=1356854 RepID=T0BTZ3_ALIAG|nr:MULTISPECIES: hypothetical protein [Alicyclobacillus]EPZ44304.1 hypothetical protein N007_11250 [Alicyclobacillus acidoterrestris ATCC 49025]UNO51085.1 hypothetical protein K1I37_21145 [Alicyclobacillus acidoterrestris]GEO27713.1 hypothetical protein AAC03nite_34980 [Alicyclobacillus acidoterrestris]
MLNKTAIHLKRLLDELKKGIHTPSKLAESLNLSKRHVYRLLELGLASGEIVKVASGVYIHQSTNVISFHSYMSNVKMSQSEQHNKTKHNITNSYDDRSTSQDKKNINGIEASDKIRAIVTFVCDKAGLIASELELKRAERILRKAIVRQSEIDFLSSNDSLLEEYTMECVRRMVERLEADPEAIQVNLVAYFFGIFRNVVRADARVWYRQWKEMLKEGSGLEIAAGNEGAEYMSPLPSSTYEESKVASNSEEENKNTVLEVPEQWTYIAVGLEDLVAKYSLRRSAVHRASVYRVIVGLHEEGIQPMDVQRALDDVVQHDPRAAEYLVRQVKSGLVDETIAQLERHYARSKTRVIDGPKKNEHKNEEPIRDARYASFYELFPES